MAVKTVNVDQSLMALDGKRPVVDTNTGEHITLCDACVSALLSTYREEVDGPTKMRRFKLSHKIQRGGDVQLSAEDIVMITELGAKSMATLVYGRVVYLLDPPTDYELGDSPITDTPTE